MRYILGYGLLLSGLFFTAAHTAPVSAIDELRCNAEKLYKKLPGKFRIPTSPYTRKDKGSPTRLGLDALRVSGSQQVTPEELGTIKKLLHRYDVIDVDLREESHGFVKNEPTWFFQNIHELDNAALRCDCARKHPDKTCAQSELSVAQNLGLQYIRIPIKDHHLPRPEAVDYFITLVQNLKQNQWLHIHCWWGHGRTTTMMCLYDMLINAGNVSAHDIMTRQRALGGASISSQDKIDFLQKFYQYACARKTGYKGLWSQWIKQKNLQPIPAAVCCA